MPAQLRFVLLVSLGVYPVITGLSYLLEPLTAGWALWQHTALLSPIMALFMVCGLIPAIHKLQAKIDGRSTARS